MSARDPGFGCEQSADAAPYVLGALEETETYREHLLGCATCRAQVAELQAVANALPASAPPVRAPDSLRSRVLATVRSEAELLKAAGGDVAERSPRLARWRSPRFSLAGAAIVVTATLAAAVTITIAANPTSPERVTSAQVAASIRGAQASLRQSDGHAELVVSGMPQPPLGKIYEVWLARASAPPQPTNALFGVTNSGGGATNVPGSLHGVKEVLVTSEPRGGSLRPTSSPVLRVVLHA